MAKESKHLVTTDHNQAVAPIEAVARRIYIIRGQRVMLDADLAELYGVPTRRLNEQVKRNRARFPADFMFQLTREEASRMRSQIATASRRNVRFFPYAFTEHGVAMLSSVLNSERAIEVNILIMRAFIRLREMLGTHRDSAQKLDELERKYERHDAEIQEIFEAIHQLIEQPVPPRRQIGFKPGARKAPAE